MRGLLWRASNVYSGAEISLEPAAEIHRSVVHGHADVSEIAGAVTRRYVHAAAQRDGEVGKIAAHAASFGMGVPRCLARARVLVTEREAIVDIVANRLHQRPTLRNLPEKGPRRIRQAIGLAVAAGKQVEQSVHRQIVQCMLLRLGPIASGSPSSCTRKSVDTFIRPAGARIT